MEWREFLAMGGYARYVWPAYALTAAVLALNWYAARRFLRQQRASALRRLAGGTGVST